MKVPARAKRALYVYLPTLMVCLIVGCTGTTQLEKDTIAAYNADQNQEALLLVDSLIAMDDSHGVHYWMKGMILLRLERHEEALNMFDSAIERDPLDHENHYARYKTHLILGSEYRILMRDLNKALELDPSNHKYHIDRLIRTYTVKNYEAARTEVNWIRNHLPTLESDTIWPTSSSVLCDYTEVMMLVNEERCREAIKLGEQAVISHPTSPDVYEALSFAHKCAGQLDQASDQLRFQLGILAKEMEHDSALYAVAQNNLGELLTLEGQLDSAKMCFAESKQLFPDNPYLYRNLGLLHEQLGNVDSACVLWNQALELGYAEKYGDDVSEMIRQGCP